MCFTAHEVVKGEGKVIEISRGIESAEPSKRRSSYKEQRENALAPGADEGRGKLRKAAGNCTQVSIRRCPNGETRDRKSVV